jgi:TonB family protein
MILADSPSASATAVTCAQPNAPARVIKLVRPVGTAQYLETSRKTGVVDVRVYLERDGKVIKAVIVRSAGDPFLDGATYDAAVATTYGAEVRDCETIPGAYIYRTKYVNTPTSTPAAESNEPSVAAELLDRGLGRKRFEERSGSIG